MQDRNGDSILVNALAMRLGGGLTYVVSQLMALERVRPDLTLHVLGSTVNASILRKSLRAKVTSLRLPGVASRFAFEQTILPYVARRHAILYCVGNHVPLLYGRTPTVVTIHNPNYFGTGRMLPQNRTMRT